MKAITKAKLSRGEPALGGWTMIGHPIIAELMAGEGFDWIAVDLEHTAIGLETFQTIAMAVRAYDCDVFARLPGCYPEWGKKVLDAGASGIIVPSVNTPEQAAQAVQMATYPPAGNRGVALCRAADYGRSFQYYYHNHNNRVVVAIMIEHIAAVESVDSILRVPGIDAVFIGPYDLSASMGLAGQLDHTDVIDAQARIIGACKRFNIASGIHVVSPNPVEVDRRIDEGYRFIACGIDTQFILQGCRHMLKRAVHHE